MSSFSFGSNAVSQSLFSVSQAASITVTHCPAYPSPELPCQCLKSVNIDLFWTFRLFGSVCSYPSPFPPQFHFQFHIALFSFINGFNTHRFSFNRIRPTPIVAVFVYLPSLQVNWNSFNALSYAFPTSDSAGSFRFQFHDQFSDQLPQFQFQIHHCSFKNSFTILESRFIDSWRTPFDADLSVE